MTKTFDELHNEVKAMDARVKELEDELIPWRQQKGARMEELQKHLEMAEARRKASAMPDEEKP